MVCYGILIKRVLLFLAMNGFSTAIFGIELGKCIHDEKQELKYLNKELWSEAL